VARGDRTGQGDRRRLAALGGAAAQLGDVAAMASTLDRPMPQVGVGEIAHAGKVLAVDVIDVIDHGGPPSLVSEAYEVS
jgi:hypothetical protein